MGESSVSQFKMFFIVSAVIATSALAYYSQDQPCESVQQSESAQVTDNTKLKAAIRGDASSRSKPVESKLEDPRIETLATDRLPTVKGSRVSDRFPNIELLDQNGRTLRFYDDIIKDRCVCLVFFYTRCTGSCPTTTVTLKALRKAIKDEFPGEEMKFVSLTLEPFVDTPEELRAYMKRYSISEDASLPEWIYATGDFDEIDNLRRTLGLYELDPILDADKTQHASLVTFGNDRLNRWAALPADMNRDDLRNTIIRIAGNTFRQRYANTLNPVAVQPKSSRATPFQ